MAEEETAVEETTEEVDAGAAPEAPAEEEAPAQEEAAVEEAEAEVEEAAVEEAPVEEAAPEEAEAPAEEAETEAAEAADAGDAGGDYKEPEPEPEPAPEPVKEEAPPQTRPKSKSKSKKKGKVADYGTGTADAISFDSPKDAWKSISKKKNKVNWYLYSVTKKIKLKFYKAGTQGLNELLPVLKESKKLAFFGLLRVNSTDKGGSVRAKFIFIRFVGSKVPVMRKAKITPNSGKFSDNFPVKHLTYDLDEGAGDFDINSLAKEFLRVGGAHKPDAYVFGPGDDQVYTCK